MDKKKLGELYPIFLVTHKDQWVEYYANEKEHLRKVLNAGDNYRMEHIGSTAVPGIKSKPTIDILVETPKIFGNSEEVITLMIANGYIHMKEQNRHLMFIKGYGPDGLEPISYHIHMGPLDQDWLWDRIYFCRYLREYSEVAEEYERLKESLAREFEFDREAYTEGKGPFIKRITDKAKMQYCKR